MTAVADLSPGAPPRPHPAAGFPAALSGAGLEALRGLFEQAAAVVDEVSPDAELVDRMAALVALRNSVDAALTATEHSFARAHAATAVASGDVEPERLERSIGVQIGSPAGSPRPWGVTGCASREICTTGSTTSVPFTRPGGSTTTG